MSKPRIRLNSKCITAADLHLTACISKSDKGRLTGRPFPLPGRILRIYRFGKRAQTDPAMPVSDQPQPDQSASAARRAPDRIHQSGIVQQLTHDLSYRVTIILKTGQSRTLASRMKTGQALHARRSNPIIPSRPPHLRVTRWTDPLRDASSTSILAATKGCLPCPPNDLHFPAMMAKT